MAFRKPRDQSCDKSACEIRISRCPVYEYLTFYQFREIGDLMRCYCAGNGNWTKEFIILAIFTAVYFLLVLLFFFYILHNLQICFDPKGSLFCSPSRCSSIPPLKNIWCVLKPRTTDLKACWLWPPGVLTEYLLKLVVRELSSNKRYNDFHRNYLLGFAISLCHLSLIATLTRNYVILIVVGTSAAYDSTYS